MMIVNAVLFLQFWFHVFIFRLLVTLYLFFSRNTGNSARVLEDPLRAGGP